MTISRRLFLQHLAVGTAMVGAVAAVPAHASHSARMKIPPRQHKPLKAQPPYRFDETKWKKRHKKMKNKPRFRARSLRAQWTFDNPGDRRCLALTMWGEARGYGTMGMLCVGMVILNRVKADKTRFGKGLSGVCLKRKQFSCWNKNEQNRKRMDKLPHMDETNPDWLAFMKADKLAGELMAGVHKDITGGATYYVAEDCIPYWRNEMTLIGVMFGHMFFKPKARRERKRIRHTHSHNSHHTKRPIHHYDHSHTSHHR